MLPFVDLTQDKHFGKFLVYLVGFFAVWSAYVAFVYPHIEAIGTTTFFYAAFNILCKSLIWMLPVFVFLRSIDQVNPVDYLKLRTNWQRGVLVAIILSVGNFLLYSLTNGTPQPDPQAITWNSILSGSIAVGFIEEILFRGFILQKFAGVMNFWLANVVTSLLFVLVHVIGWILLGDAQNLSLDIGIPLFVFSFVLGAAFYYSKSLWSCILTHSFNDFLGYIIFTG